MNSFYDFLGSYLKTNPILKKEGDLRTAEDYFLAHFKDSTEFQDMDLIWSICLEKNQPVFYKTLFVKVMCQDKIIVYFKEEYDFIENEKGQKLGPDGFLEDLEGRIEQQIKEKLKTKNLDLSQVYIEKKYKTKKTYLKQENLEQERNEMRSGMSFLNNMKKIKKVLSHEQSLWKIQMERDYLNASIPNANSAHLSKITRI